MHPAIKLPQLPFLTREMLTFGNTATLQLRLATQSDAAVTLAVRGLTRSGIISFNQVPTNNSVLSIRTQKIDDIPISVSVIDLDGQLAQGQTFCRLSLLINGDIVAELASGWVYTQKNLTFPAINQQDLHPNAGFFGLESGSNPAANTEATITVPTGEVWQVHAIIGTLVADANVATRRVEITFSDGTTVFMAVRSDQGQSNDETRIYSFFDKGNDDNDTIGTSVVGTLPPRLVLPAASIISTRTDQLQAGDDWTAISAWVERFFTPA